MNQNEFEKYWEDLKDNFGEFKLPNKDFIFRKLKTWPIEKFEFTVDSLTRSLKSPILRNFEDIGRGWNIPSSTFKLTEMSYKEQGENLKADEMLKTIDSAEKQIIFNLIEPYRPPNIDKNSRWFFSIPARIFMGSQPDLNFKKLITDSKGKELPRFRELIDGKWVENEKTTDDIDKNTL